LTKTISANRKAVSQENFSENFEKELDDCVH